MKLLHKSKRGFNTKFSWMLAKLEFFFKKRDLLSKNSILFSFRSWMFSTFTRSWSIIFFFSFTTVIYKIINFQFFCRFKNSMIILKIIWNILCVTILVSISTFGRIILMFLLLFSVRCSAILFRVVSLDVRVTE